jgi:hypothetical protein
MSNRIPKLEFITMAIVGALTLLSMFTPPMS